MGRLTYFFLQTALFFGVAIVFLDYLQIAFAAFVLMFVGICMAIVGTGEANNGRYR